MIRLKELPKAFISSKTAEKTQNWAVRENVYRFYTTVPAHPCNMKLKDQKDLQMVIIPAVDIMLLKRAVIDETFFDRDGISYRISGTDRPFPFGHIYQGSGHLCLGSLFVPCRVHRLTPMFPLETLFVNNDRNVGHGNAFLCLTNAQIAAIDNLLPGDKTSGLTPKINLIETDDLWAFSAHIYQTYPLKQAISLMEAVYAIIFEIKRPLTEIPQ